MGEHFEIAIIGAGPAGIAAAVSASENKLSHILFEKSEVANTIYDYQLGKLVMAEPGKLPLRGTVEFKQGTREEILEAWNEGLSNAGVNLRKAEVTAIKRNDSTFEIQTTQGNYTTNKVILAIGVQGSPRKLGVPGDSLAHVAYTLADPGAFNGMDILVVGAGDSAIENALALAEKNTVSLLNRTAEFPRAKEANVAKIMDAINTGKVRLFSNAAVSRVESEQVYINAADGEVKIKCNHIIARLGCILPRKFLEAIGIQFPSADADAVPVVNSKYESNVPNLYILGALIGYPLIKHAMNQGFEVIQHILGNPVEPADQVLVEEKLKVLPGNVNQNLQMIREKLPLFKDLSDPQFRELIIDSTVHMKKAGEVVFERNDYTDTFWSVISGAVAIEIGADKQVKIQQGNFFGEMGLLSGRRRTATVRTSENSILLESPRKQILKLMASVASVKKTLDESFMLRALQTSIFPEASLATLERLVKRAKMRSFKKGEALFKEGDIGDAVYVIRKGSVKISRKNSSGANITQTYLAAGNIVGEMALLSLDPKARSATVVAAVACETILIEKADFLNLLDEAPDVKRKVEELSRRREVENITSHQNEYWGKLLDFAMSEGISDADNFLLIDSDLCVACDNCEKACAVTHSGVSRLNRKGGKTYACVQIPVSCRHCENPLCMLDCPPDALQRMPNGEVIIKDCCIGCGNCTRNCPYGVIQLVHDHEQEPFSLFSLFSSKPKHKEEGPAKAAKCDMCHTLEGGPACVRNCPTGAAMRVNPSALLRIISEKQGVGT